MAEGCCEALVEGWKAEHEDLTPHLRRDVMDTISDGRPIRGYVLIVEWQRDDPRNGGWTRYARHVDGRHATHGLIVTVSQECITDDVLSGSTNVSPRRGA